MPPRNLVANFHGFVHLWYAKNHRRLLSFLADSLISGIMYPHKVGLASHICNGNFGEVCTLSRWESTVTPPLGQTCTGQMNPKTRPWEGHCR
jgi:hypothetical protein